MGGGGGGGVLCDIPAQKNRVEATSPSPCRLYICVRIIIMNFLL